MTKDSTPHKGGFQSDADSELAAHRSDAKGKRTQRIARKKKERNDSE